VSRWLIVSVISVLSVSSSAAQQPADSVSIDRVRDALEKPPSRLTLQDRKPDFSIDIHERERLEHLLPPWWFEEGGDTSWLPKYSARPELFGSQPMITVDLLAIAGGIAREINQARRARAQRQAVDEVRQAIIEYCAAQPGGGAGIQICDRPPAIR
jgi:hypothetical protein